MSALTLLLTGLLSGVAFAQDEAKSDDYEPPPPVVKLERIPPRASYEAWRSDGLRLHASV